MSFLFQNVVLPVLVLAAAGYFLGRRFALHLDTLSKLNFYVFVPAFLFEHLYRLPPSGSEFLVLALFEGLCFSAVALFSFSVLKLLRFHASTAYTAAFAAAVFNSANYGLPVIDLAFGGEGTVYQLLVVVVMNVLTFIVGPLLLGGGGNFSAGLRALFRLPVLYAMGAALGFPFLFPVLPVFLEKPLHWTAQGMVPVALVTLGAQLARAPRVSVKKAVALGVLLRLVGGPLCAFLLLRLLGITGLLAKVLWVSSGFPSAAVTALFALEFRREEGFAAALVFWSTVLGFWTTPILIKLSNLFF